MKKYLNGFISSIFLIIVLCANAFAQPYNVQNENRIKPDTIIYKESSKKIDKINPTTSNNASGAYYPGQRGANQLIVYTDEYGARTGTNEFGSEAIVINGVVVQIHGADSIIPQNGFVISGHGSAKNWINENITVGTKVFLDKQNMMLNTFITPDSFIFAAEEKIKEVLSIMHFYELNNPCYDREDAENYLKKAKQNLKKAQKDNDEVQKYAKRSNTLLRNSNIRV